LLTLLALRSLSLALVALRPTRALALLTLALPGGLLAVALAALRLPLILLSVSALRSLIALRRLARGLVAPAALHRLILRLTLPLLSCAAALRARALRRRALRAA
jgi:hypothetical protein